MWKRLAARLRSVLHLLANRARQLELPDLEALGHANSHGMDDATRQWLLGEIVPGRRVSESEGSEGAGSDGEGGRGARRGARGGALAGEGQAGAPARARGPLARPLLPRRLVPASRRGSAARLPFRRHSLQQGHGQGQGGSRNHSAMPSPIASFIVPGPEEPGTAPTSPGGGAGERSEGEGGASASLQGRTPPTLVAPFTGPSPARSGHGQGFAGSARPMERVVLPPAAGGEGDGAGPSSWEATSPHTLRTLREEGETERAASRPGPLLAEASRSPRAPSASPPVSPHPPRTLSPAPSKPASMVQHTSVHSISLQQSYRGLSSAAPPPPPHAALLPPASLGATLGAPRHALRRRSSGTVAARRVSLIPAPSLGPSLAPGEEAELRVALLEHLDDWLQWDVFRVGRAAPRRTLAHVAYAILRRWGLVERFQLDVARLVRFLDAVEQLYTETPYHCALHAADVVQSFSSLLAAGLGSCLRDVELLAGLLAAVVHDLGHAGFTNAFEVAVGTERAVVYNDKSPLENYHVSRAFQLLRDPQNDFLAALAPEERRELRRVMIAMVLGTDLALHFELLGNFKTRAKDPNFGATGEDRLLALQLALKCADVGNGAKARDVHFAWVARVMHEFFNQGDAERERGLAISAWSDRHTPQVARCQLGFLNFICIPMYTAWVTVFPTGRTVLDAATSNRDFWADRTDDGTLPGALSSLSLAAGVVAAGPSPAPGGPAAASSSPRGAPGGADTPMGGGGAGSWGRSKNKSFRVLAVPASPIANPASGVRMLPPILPTPPLNAVPSGPPIPPLLPAGPVIVEPAAVQAPGVPVAVAVPVPVASDLGLFASASESSEEAGPAKEGQGPPHPSAIVIDIRP
eukprot:tig00000448_g922.t1